jgi:hypothetical protein
VANTIEPTIKQDARYLDFDLIMEIWFTNSKVIHMYSTYFPDMFHCCPHAFPMFFLIRYRFCRHNKASQSRNRVKDICRFTNKSSASQLMKVRKIFSNTSFRSILETHTFQHLSEGYYGYLNWYKNRRWTGSSFKTVFFFVRLSIYIERYQYKFQHGFRNGFPYYKLWS